MRNVGVVTVARSDYGILLPVISFIENDEELKLSLIVSGMHLSEKHGRTLSQIESDGFKPDVEILCNADDDSPAGIGRSMGAAVSGYAEYFNTARPDVLMVMGDRFEMHAAAVAALPFNIPVVHLHGGELSEGAMDDSLRHSITKLSHRHLVSAQAYVDRVVQLGEEPWRVTCCGAPGLDHLSTLEYLNQEELEARTKLDLTHSPVLVTFHPVTLEYESSEVQIESVLQALEDLSNPVVFTLPNADTSNAVIAKKITEFVQGKDHACLIDNLGTQAYFSMMKIAAAMVGNSSSGIIEAASFKLPVLNIGSRQRGRLRPANVVDVECELSEIQSGLEVVLSKKFKLSLDGLQNPYDQGGAASTIVRVLKEMDLGESMIKKKFYDIDVKSTRLDNV